nr:hypothetical protein Iba_chr09cCG6920 [Ipomoea batatas]
MSHVWERASALVSIWDLWECSKGGPNQLSLLRDTCETITGFDYTTPRMSLVISYSQWRRLDNQERQLHRPLPYIDGTTTRQYTFLTSLVNLRGDTLEISEISEVSTSFGCHHRQAKQPVTSRPYGMNEIKNKPLSSTSHSCGTEKPPTTHTSSRSSHRPLDTLNSANNGENDEEELNEEQYARKHRSNSTPLMGPPDLLTQRPPSTTYSLSRQDEAVAPAQDMAGVTSWIGLIPRGADFSRLAGTWALQKRASDARSNRSGKLYIAVMALAAPEGVVERLTTASNPPWVDTRAQFAAFTPLTFLIIAVNLQRSQRDLHEEIDQPLCTDHGEGERQQRRV